MLAGGAVLLLWYLGRRKQAADAALVAADAALVAAEKAAGPGPLLLPLTATQNKSAKGGTGSTSTTTTMGANSPVLTATELRMLTNPSTGVLDPNRINDMITSLTIPWGPGLLLSPSKPGFQPK